MKSLFAIILLFLLSSIFACAQQRDLTARLLQIKSSADSLVKNYPAEKLYLQLDKPNYAAGDTLWFKAYLFNAPSLALSAKSGIMYIDIANDSNKVVKQMRLPVNNGLGRGNISLNDFPAGSYILRAYTTWMRNFGDDCFYYKRFAIVGEQSPGLRFGKIENSSILKKQENKIGQPTFNGPRTTLNLADDKDSITVSVTATNGQAQPDSSYFLIGKARNIICYAAVVNFNGEGIVKKSVPKSLFPSGVTHFVLTDTKGQQLNERLIFIDHHDNLHIELKTDKQVYALRDSIAIHVTITDSKGNPVKGNFSLAVTDDNQVGIDSLQDNMISHVLITSEINGYVKQPAYYLQHHSETGGKALDDLLFTRGWVNYDWSLGKISYQAEKQFTVSGRVTNGFNGVVKASKVTLFSKSPFLLKDTLTDKDGHFVFRNFPAIDTPVFFLKAVNHHDKSFNVGITIDEQKPPGWNLDALHSSPDTTIDTGLAAAAKNNRIRKEQAYLTPNGHLLKEVKIEAKKIVKGSQNLNGPGNADLVMDEADMVKEGKKSWLDIFQEKIKGFREQMFYTLTYYKIDDRVVIFLVDGIPITPMDVFDPQYYTDDVVYYLKTHSAEDIKGIEVNSSSQYNSKYNFRFFPGAGALTDYAFIEITTRSGDGPHLRNTPGTCLYKPLALSRPTQFYNPQYRISDISKHLPDTRSTIYWEPNIDVNTDGEAGVSFYAADKPGTYTIIIEGTDMNGNLGYKKEKIVIVKPTQNKRK